MMTCKTIPDAPEDRFIAAHMKEFFSFQGSVYLGCLIDCGASGRAAHILVPVEEARKSCVETHGVRFFWLDPLLKLSAQEVKRADIEAFCSRRSIHKPGLKGVLSLLEEMAAQPPCPDLYAGPLGSPKKALELAQVLSFFECALPQRPVAGGQEAEACAALLGGGAAR